MPVAPYTTESVPGSSPPPSIASSLGMPVETRALIRRILHRVGGAALRLKLALVEMPQLGERGRLPGRFVVTHAGDAGEAQGQLRGIGRALLDLVVLDLDDDLGPHAHGVAVVLGGQLPQPLGHLHELDRKSTRLNSSHVAISY